MAKNNGKFALGALFGALAGFFAGVLSAPQSGKKTRGDLKDTAVDLKKKTFSAAEDAKDRAVDVVDDVKERATDVVEDAKDIAYDLKDRTQRAVKSAEKEFKSDGDKSGK